MEKSSSTRDGKLQRFSGKSTRKIVLLFWGDRFDGTDQAERLTAFYGMECDLAGGSLQEMKKAGDRLLESSHLESPKGDPRGSSFKT